MKKQNPVIATHSGSFHADDVAACAVLAKLFPAATLVRTRNPEFIRRAQFAVDVGGIWDPVNGRFDHHQKGFVGARSSGVVYASAGLVWAAHGQAYVQAVAPKLTPLQAARVASSIDDELMQHLDMADTGAAQGAPGYFGLSAIISAFNTTRLEDQFATQLLANEPEKLAEDLAQAKYQQFNAAMGVVNTVLERLVAQFVDEISSEALVRNAPTAFDGQVLVLPESGLTWAKVICAEMPDVKFVVYPDLTDNQYQVRTVPVAPESFKARMDLPAAWAGLRDADLAAVTGVPDAVFCHNARFIAGAVSKEGALRMTELALLQ